MTKLYTIYCKALENNSVFEKKMQLKKKISMIGYHFALVFLNKYIPHKYTKLHIINGNAEMKFAAINNYENIFYGVLHGNIKKFYRSYTILSHLNKYQRIKIWIKAIIEYYYKRIEKGNLIYWVDFRFWENMLQKSTIQEILSDGHYDRITTQLSFLCKHYNIIFSMQQHGLICSKQYIWHKIYCDELYAFDRFEISKFQSSIIENASCAYKIRYISNIKFVETEKNVFTIGVIDQPINESLEILDIVEKNCYEYKKILMLHPLSDKANYHKYYEDFFIYDKEKEWNLDLIISTPSTLAYDYIQKGFKAPILFIDTKGVMSDFQDKFDNLIYINRMEMLCGIIKEQLPSNV